MSTKTHPSPILPGRRTGRTIGYPTINLDPAAVDTLSPEQNGVYAVTVRFEGALEQLGALKGAAYIGPRTVFGETARVFEVYLLDFDREVYGEQVQIELCAFIRPVLELDGLDALKNQLAHDETAVRQYFQNHPITSTQ